MTTTRDAFEAEANLYDLDLNRFKEGYSDCNTEYSWTFWQAATLAAQGKRQPLTAAQIAVLISNVCDTDDQSLVDFVRDVEAAHGIKA